MRAAPIKTQAKMSFVGRSCGLLIWTWLVAWLMQGCGAMYMGENR